ncbi:hypothetical protein Hanom_Chr16g01506121 [Helianthus anomalus]
MTSTLEVKLRGIFLTDNLPENLTNPVGDIFSKVVSAVTNFFLSLTGLFNQEFPSEKRDDQLKSLIDVARPYFLPIAVVFLIMFLCYGRLLFSFILSIPVWCFKAVCSILGFIYRCLWFGASAGLKTMIGTSQPLLLVSMAAIEAPISLALSA